VSLVSSPKFAPASSSTNNARIISPDLILGRAIIVIELIGSHQLLRLVPEGNLRHVVIHLLGGEGVLVFTGLHDHSRGIAKGVRKGGEKEETGKKTN
jgi:hypothetical protein